MRKEQKAGHDEGKGVSTTLSALQHFDQLPNSAHVRLPIVMALTGFSSATVWRRAKDGTIPKPIKLSIRVTAWNVGQLRQALALIADGAGVLARHDGALQ